MEKFLYILFAIVTIVLIVKSKTHIEPYMDCEDLSKYIQSSAAQDTTLVGLDTFVLDNYDPLQNTIDDDTFEDIDSHKVFIESTKNRLQALYENCRNTYQENTDSILNHYNEKQKYL